MESKLDLRWLSWRACAKAASATSGAEAPMLFDHAIEVQSMYSLPVESQTSAPEALAMTRPGSLPDDHPRRRAPVCLSTLDESHNPRSRAGAAR